MLTDRISDSTIGSGESEAAPLRRHRIVILALAVVADLRSMEPGDRRLEMRWREIRAKLVDPQIASHLGQIVSGKADCFIAEFRNALNAVRCAVEAQRDVAAANAKTLDIPPIEVRIGVHLSESLVAGLTTYEDIVKAAIRLQESAEPGEIVVSVAVQEQVAGAQDIATEPLARPRLEKAFGGDPVFRVVPQQVVTQSLGRTTPIPSLAVLSFSGACDPGNDYLTEGIVNDIVGALSTVSDLLVVSPSSTLSFRDAEVDVRTVARHLGVRYVVTGTVQRTADRVSLTPELSDAETGAVIWRKRYDVALRKIFDMQRDIARRIACALVPSLGAAELRRVTAKRPESLDAYDLVLQAMHRMYRLDREDFIGARALLERAIQMDPGYAAAYTFMALWHHLNVGQGYCESQSVASMELVRAAESAIERHPADAHALALLGHNKAWFFRDYDAALDLFERAFAAAPNSAFAWGWSSPTFSYLGDGTTGAARAEYALRLCPLGPYAYLYRTALNLAHYTSGNYDEAVRWGRRAMAINPRYEANLRFLAASLAACGRIREAGAVARSLLALQPNFSVKRFAARYAYRDAGRNAVLAEHLRLAGLPD